ncbi:hypothetical protein M407DRAFT_109999 [Tulasnella calospora MUT 4182]|uniref:Uncharacterized protein n=1 Tax=Tulasnella calospora MUT 4182 TaxID=1051891 RepID=A0A0C3Q3S9_9AGAM|nr:hypothetical protein M407DRAFT_109999 [Tulasnella calospora MUT 4182]
MGTILWSFDPVCFFFCPFLFLSCGFFGRRLFFQNSNVFRPPRTCSPVRWGFFAVLAIRPLLSLASLFVRSLGHLGAISLSSLVPLPRLRPCARAVTVTCISDRISQLHFAQTYDVFVPIHDV